MRKAKAPPPPAPFVWLRDILPDVSNSLRADLHRIGQNDLAEQVRELRVYDRSRWRAVPCGAFYSAPEAELPELRQGAMNIGDVTVARGRIVRVETLSSAVDEVLRHMFP